MILPLFSFLHSFPVGKKYTYFFFFKYRLQIGTYMYILAENTRRIDNGFRLCNLEIK